MCGGVARSVKGGERGGLAIPVSFDNFSLVRTSPNRIPDREDSKARAARERHTNRRMRRRAVCSTVHESETRIILLNARILNSLQNSGKPSEMLTKLLVIRAAGIRGARKLPRGEVVLEFQ